MPTFNRPPPFIGSFGQKRGYYKRGGTVQILFIQNFSGRGVQGSTEKSFINTVFWCKGIGFAPKDKNFRKRVIIILKNNFEDNTSVFLILFHLFGYFGHKLSALH